MTGWTQPEGAPDVISSEGPSLGDRVGSCIVVAFLTGLVQQLDGRMLRALGKVHVPEGRREVTVPG